MATVTLVNYQLEWPTRFREAAGELNAAFAGLPIYVEHIGSTSVIGLCAKPVIDILLGALSLPQIETKATALANFGYRYRPEYEADLPDRRYFTRQQRSDIRIHLHAVVHGGTLWKAHITFRDALRADPELARSYATLKHELARVHADNRSAYTEGKGPFIGQVLARMDQVHSNEARADLGPRSLEGPKPTC